MAFAPPHLLAVGGGLDPPPLPMATLPPPLPGTQLAAAIAAATRQDEDGDTALHIAVAHGSVPAARLLIALFLRGRCAIDVYNRLRQTPLHLAVITGHPALVRLLLSHGSCPSLPDRLGRSAAHLACEGGAGGARCLRELLRGGGRPEMLQARDYEGLTPLHVAVSAGCHESAELLLLHGADVDAPDTKSGRTALLRAVESNSLEMAELLLRHGAAVNAQSYAGCTALHAAAGRGLVGALRLLLRNGADLGLRNNHHETALALASSRQVIDILRGKAAANQSAEQGGAPRPPPRADQWEEEEEKGGVAERFPPKCAKLRPREGRGLVAPPTAEH